MTDFLLDQRLEADTLPIRELGLCSLRLMNDSRWPWLILVPRKVDIYEVHELSRTDQHALIDEAAQVGHMLKALTGFEKINTAALGNIVRQIHIHVIAREEGDANWPGPVWGFEKKLPYTGEAARQLIDRILQYDF